VLRPEAGVATIAIDKPVPRGKPVTRRRGIEHEVGRSKGFLQVDDLCDGSAGFGSRFDPRTVDEDEGRIDREVQPDRRPVHEPR